MNYLDQFPLALKSVQDVFVHNEYKHGEGVKFKSFEHELEKALCHGVKAMQGKYNLEDQNYHIQAALNRMLKAIEIFLNENPQDINENYHKFYEK